MHLAGVKQTRTAAKEQATSEDAEFDQTRPHREEKRRDERARPRYIYRGHRSGAGGLLEEAAEVLDVVLAPETLVEMIHLKHHLDDNQVDDDQLEIHLGSLGENADERFRFFGEVIEFSIEDVHSLGYVQRTGYLVVDSFETGL